MLLNLLLLKRASQRAPNVRSLSAQRLFTRSAAREPDRNRQMAAFEKAAIQHKPLWRMATKGLERLSFSPNLGAMLRHLEGLQRAMIDEYCTRCQSLFCLASVDVRSANMAGKIE